MFVLWSSSNWWKFQGCFQILFSDQVQDEETSTNPSDPIYHLSLELKPFQIKILEENALKKECQCQHQRILRKFSNPNLFFSFTIHLPRTKNVVKPPDEMSRNLWFSPSPELVFCLLWFVILRSLLRAFVIINGNMEQEHFCDLLFDLCI